MNKHKLSLKAVLYLLIVGFVFTANAAYAANEIKAEIVNQADLKWKPLPNMPKGAQIAMVYGDPSKAERYVFQLKLPSGYTIPSHWHSKDEETTVISGTLYFGIGDKINKSEAKKLSAGSYSYVPGNVHHYLWCDGETIIQDTGMGPRDTTFVNPEELKALIAKQGN